MLRKTGILLSIVIGSTADAEKLAAEINTNRENQSWVVQANLDKDDHVARLIEDTKSCYGRLDAIVNNASAFTLLPLEVSLKKIGINSSAVI